MAHERLQLLDQNEDDNNGKDKIGKKNDKIRKVKSMARKRRNSNRMIARNVAARICRLVLDIRLCLLAALLAIPPFFVFLWVSGLSALLFEKPFTEFQWPPFGVDVRKQVILELLGKPTEVPPMNDWNNFRPFRTPSCRHNQLTRKRSILAIVKTAPNRHDRREVIRSSFGSLNTNNLNGFRFRVVFALGLPMGNNGEEIATLDEEAATFGDMIIGNFTDHYHNNTHKFINSIAFANDHCGGGTVPFLLLLDDDYLLLPWNLAAEAGRHVANERLYMGWRYDTTPFRLRFRKFWISLDEYPFNRYPPYITGGAVLMSGQTVSEFHAAIRHTALFKFDDIFAGILAHLLAIQPQHNPNFLNVHHQAGQQLSWWRQLIAAHGYSPKELKEAYGLALKEWLSGS